MKRIRFTIALATILFATACHNANSSTAQEIEDKSPAKVEAHGDHAKPAEHGAAMHEEAARDTTMAHDSSAATDTVPHQH